MSIIISGEFYRNQSSEGRAGRLIVDGDDVRVDITDVNFQTINMRRDFLRSEMRIEPKLSTLVRKIYLPDGLQFQTHESAAVDSLDNRARWKLIAKLEKTGWHLVPFAILTPILAVSFYRMMIPLIIGLGLFLTPAGVPARIDTATLGSLDKIWMRPSRTQDYRQDELRVIFDDLVQQRHKARDHRVPDYTLEFRRMRPAMPNAFALPGGTVVLTDTLIKDFDDDDVLAAILAHEIAHVEYEHSLRQIYRAIGMAALINMIAGDAGPMLEDLLLEGSALLSLSFSRKHESQADKYAVEMMHNIGRPPEKMALFFEAIQNGDMKLTKPRNPLPIYDDQGDQSLDAEFDPDPAPDASPEVDLRGKNWFSSHPLNQERIDDIRRWSAELRGEAVPEQGAE
ncbi:M48 family metallopeptidase [Fretibacter rubidus]|uniref:M48 family metallopeptidase n=1 Tax=Fretibacter rubidus TaxID=570162 RepID=UPI00352AC811